MTGILRDVNDIPTIYLGQRWADPYAFDLVEESLPGQVKRAGTSVIRIGVCCRVAAGIGHPITACSLAQGAGGPCG